MNQRTRKRAERVGAVIEKIQSDFQTNLGDVSDGKEFDDCRVLILEGHDGGAWVTLTYDGAGFEYWSYDSEFNFSLRTKLAEKLRKFDKELYFEDCNSWSLSIYIEGR